MSDEKTVRIIVKGEAEYSVGGCVVHRVSEDRSKEFDYADFFDRVIQRLGQERVLDLVGGTEEFDAAVAAGGSSSGRPT